jgi:hypothetical protein
MVAVVTAVAYKDCVSVFRFATRLAFLDYDVSNCRPREGGKHNIHYRIYGRHSSSIVEGQAEERSSVSRQQWAEAHLITV